MSSPTDREGPNVPNLKNSADAVQGLRTALEGHTAAMDLACGRVDAIREDICIAFRSEATGVFSAKMDDWQRQYKRVTEAHRQLLELINSGQQKLEDGSQDAIGHARTTPVSDYVLNALSL